MDTTSRYCPGTSRAENPATQIWDISFSGTEAIWADDLSPMDRNFRLPYQQEPTGD